MCRNSYKKEQKIQLEPIHNNKGYIAPLEDQPYSYLGIKQKINICGKENKLLLEDMCKANLHLICQTKLNSKHLIQAINTYALPSLLYIAAVLNWSDLELKTLDIKTRKILRTITSWELTTQ